MINMHKIILALVALAFLFIRMDGQTIGEWTTYVSPTQLNDVLEEDNTVYLATDAGIFVVNKTTHQVEHWTKQSHGLPSNKIEAITRDPFTQTMFIGTYDIALAYQLPNGQFQHLPYPEEILPNQASDMVLTYCLETDAEGNWWIGTNRGLLKYDGANWQLFDQSNVANFFRSVWNMAKDSEGRLLIATHGLYRKEHNGDLTMLTPDDFSAQLFAYSSGRTLYQDNGDTWFLTDVGTLGRLTENGWTVYDQQDFPQNFFLDDKILLQDQTGLVWVRSANGQFAKFDGQTWVEANPDTDPDDATITNVYFGESARLLFAPGELRIQNDDNSVALSLGNYPFEAAVYAFVNDHEGNLWAREGYSRLRNLTNGDTLSLTNTAGANLYFYDMAFDAQGAMWGLSFNALYKYFDGQWIAFDHTNSILPNTNDLRELAVDDNGVVWVAAQDFGLYKYNGQSWEHFNNSLLANNYVLDIVTDADNRLWLSILLDVSFETRIYRLEGQNLIQAMNGYTLTNTALLQKDKATGRLYASGSGNHIEYWENDTWNDIPLPVSNSPYIHTFVTRNEDMILAAENKMLLFSDGEWAVFDPSNSPLPASNIVALGIDYTGKIWITHSIANSVETYQSGIVNATDEQFEAHTPISLALYPNPAKNTASIGLLEEQGDFAGAVCKISDVSGRLVAQFELQSPNIDISQLAPGIYWVQVKHNKWQGAAKLVKH